MRQSVIKFVIGLLSLVSFIVSAEMDIKPHRSFGYMIGDVLEQTILLEIDGASVEIQKLPELKRKGRWLQLISTSIHEDKDSKRWLKLAYQIINAPTEPVTAALPALSLMTTTGKTIQVTSMPFGLVPMTLAIKSKDNVLPMMQADHQPQKPDSTGIQKRLIQTGLALAVTLLSWTGWWLWRQQADAKHLPFAKAMHRIRKLRAKEGDPLDENPQAWSILHHAFNETAGHTLSSQSVAALLQRESWLQPFELRIMTFYSSSDMRFFKPDTTVESFPLFDLCKALYLAEKNQAIALDIAISKGAH